MRLRYNGSTVADITFITERLAVGGAIWTRDNLDAVRRAGVTHVINTQIEFDDRILTVDDHPRILHLGTEDDFMPKPAGLFQLAVDFALAALAEPRNKILVHCASGIHRGPMVALAILRALGFSRHDAMRLIVARRPQADFPNVYVESVENFIAEWEAESSDLSDPAQGRSTSS